ncbi:hypothetical protein B0H17DRAFT_1209355 [Mycena rosella]|uniref:Uncharacterized protein n=1 Tax=Mycena rosella TaxID=1033263 RepID=A0AAD7CYW5_MYCRO|nr:hypothetical protein B0H17DRAFT_1209355 [Mycena rosella]
MPSVAARCTSRPRLLLLCIGTGAGMRGIARRKLPSVNSKGKVNHIAKNKIELTYNATLTSLEEMMRIMMDNQQIHPDVIAKLWSVINKMLPKEQRQGAIIILGMLALAKHGVLTDHVDVMLQVGLGQLGKIDLMLTRHTCVTLQRLHLETHSGAIEITPRDICNFPDVNGSAKKIKGSLLDKTIWIEIENPIFQKLQEAVEHLSWLNEWFRLVEQVISLQLMLVKDRKIDVIIAIDAVHTDDTDGFPEWARDLPLHAYHHCHLCRGEPQLAPRSSAAHPTSVYVHRGTPPAQGPLLVYIALASDRDPA